MQNTIGFLSCKRTLLAHVQFLIPWYPQVLLCWTALNPFVPQFALILGTVPTQVQDLALGLAELHDVCMDHSSSLPMSLWVASHPSRVASQFYKDYKTEAKTVSTLSVRKCPKATFKITFVSLVLQHLLLVSSH